MTTRHPDRKLSSHALPWPVNWAALFGVSRPLILEIGFGNGIYTVHLAQQNPNTNIVGVEIANQSLLRAEKRLNRHDITNVRLVHSKAETALHHLFTPNSLSQIHINFPDPWFKSKHERRRLMQRDTLDAMVNRLQPGGMLYLATDIVEYAEMSADLLEETPGLTNTLDARWWNEMPGRVVTHYEGKAIKAGRVRHYFAYRRNETPAPNVPVIEELDMPHIVFDTPLDIDAMWLRFEKSDHPIGDETYISFLSAYRNERTLLVDAYVREPTIDQRVALLITTRDTGEYTVQVGTMGHPRMTDGVHRAVALLGEWLLSLHPDAQAVKAKVKGFQVEHGTD